jgi:hypothetical protein
MIKTEMMTSTMSLLLIHPVIKMERLIPARINKIYPKIKPINENPKELVPIQSKAFNNEPLFK